MISDRTLTWIMYLAAFAGVVMGWAQESYLLALGFAIAMIAIARTA